MALLFSKPWTLPRTRFDCAETADELRWQVRQETARAAVEIAIRCRKRDMLLINYEAPGGRKLHNRLWNGGNGAGVVTLWRTRGGATELVDEMDAARVGCEYGEYGA